MINPYNWMSKSIQLIFFPLLLLMRFTGHKRDRNGKNSDWKYKNRKRKYISNSIFFSRVQCKYRPFTLHTVLCKKDKILRWCVWCAYFEYEAKCLRKFRHCAIMVHPFGFNTVFFLYLAKINIIHSSNKLSIVCTMFTLVK